MKVGVKYCGGCNPRYARQEFVRRLERALPAAEFLVPVSGADDADVILVVCGCASACAGHETLSGRLGKWVVTGEEDFSAILKKLKTVMTEPE